jgi:cytochrome c oxidase assembly protein subunit 15
MTQSKSFLRIAALAATLAFCVIVFGAFVRLSNAGLSCPDWPTCYGRATWPTAPAEAASHVASEIRSFDTTRAWREQVHRHLAATLGMLVLALALLAARGRRRGVRLVAAAATLVAVGIPLYIQANYGWAIVAAGTGEAILLAAAWRWDNRDLARVATLTLAVVVFQALLGMWTVTWLLKPIVVMGHLLGGMTTFSLLLWMALRSRDTRDVLRNGADASVAPRIVALRVALVLVAIQIALGGWTSSNYAALACGLDFPTCQGRWWPDTDFGNAFVLWRGVGVDYEGGVLDGPARAAIQLSHRLFALLVAGHLLGLALRCVRTPGWRHYGAAVAVLLTTQVALGIANVKLGLPLAVACAHNGVAALLLGGLVAMLARRTRADA